MSTNDVPGSNPANNDVLAMGAWAEHEDGSLIFVESTEGNRVVYSIFDVSKRPIVEYRDAMPEDNFKRQFSWKPGSRRGKTDITATEKWTWHDKTPFPWSRVIQHGAQDGLRYASAADQLTAAERVAQSLNLRATEFDARRRWEVRRDAQRRTQEQQEPGETQANRTARILAAFDNFREVLEEELTANGE